MIFISFRKKVERKLVGGRGSAKEKGRTHRRTVSPEATYIFYGVGMDQDLSPLKSQMVAMFLIYHHILHFRKSMSHTGLW